MIGRGLSSSVGPLTIKGIVMRSLRTIATLASAAAIVGSIFAVSWVSLALLGF